MSYCLCPIRESSKNTPQSIALIDEHGALSYKELDSLIQSFEYQLKKWQVVESDIIAIYHPICREFIAVFFAIFRIGATICPLNLRLPQNALENQLRELKPKLFINQFPLHPIECPNPQKSPIGQSAFIFTSGSTGSPKIAVLTLKQLLTNARFNIPLEEKDQWLLNLPLYHVGGIGIILRCALKSATIVLSPQIPTITHISCVPTQLYRHSPTYKHLKSVLIGGSPISIVPHHLPVIASYGLTEMGSIILFQEKPTIENGLLFLSKKLDKREIQIREDGEIFVKGETLFEGYYKNNEIQTPLEDGWFPTKDIGIFDPQKGISIQGRKDLQFISGGENIQPEEIEIQLKTIPNVLEAVIVPIEDPEFGQKPVAVIETSDKMIDPQSIQKQLAEVLPKYKIPKHILLTSEIPKTGVKIDRKKILKLVEKHFLNKD